MGWEIHTQRLCTRVSIAILPCCFAFGSPGNPFGTAKDRELDFENCNRRSSDGFLACYVNVATELETHSGLQRSDGRADGSQSGYHAHFDCSDTIPRIH